MPRAFILFLPLLIAAGLVAFFPPSSLNEWLPATGLAVVATPSQTCVRTCNSQTSVFMKSCGDIAKCQPVALEKRIACLKQCGVLSPEAAMVAPAPPPALVSQPADCLQSCDRQAQIFYNQWADAATRDQKMAEFQSECLKQVCHR